MNLLPLLDVNGQSAVLVNIFLWFVLLPGSVLLLMFVTNKQPYIGFASWVLEHNLQTRYLGSIGSKTMIIICGLFGLLSYSSMRRYQLQATSSSGPFEQDRKLKIYFHESRNLWISVLSAVVWLLAMRLNSLYKYSQLVRLEAIQSKSVSQRVVWVLVAIFCLIVADLPLCRLNYSATLMTYVTPPKNQLLASASSGIHSQCSDVFLDKASGPCTDFCTKAKELSQVRLDTVLWVRQYHMLGRVAAEVFDGTRGVEQGSDRIDDLFKKKTCKQVLQSVDKSNQLVNYICMFACFVSLFGCLTAATKAMEGQPATEDQATEVAKDTHAHQE